MDENAHLVLSWINGKTEKLEWKKYLIIDDYILKKILNKSKEIISVEKLIVTTILIDTDDKLPDDITFKKALY